MPDTTFPPPSYSATHIWIAGNKYEIPPPNYDVCKRVLGYKTFAVFVAETFLRNEEVADYYLNWQKEHYNPHVDFSTAPPPPLTDDQLIVLFESNLTLNKALYHYRKDGSRRLSIGNIRSRWNSGLIVHRPQLVSHSWSFFAGKLTFRCRKGRSPWHIAKKWRIPDPRYLTPDGLSYLDPPEEYRSGGLASRLENRKKLREKGLKNPRKSAKKKIARKVNKKRTGG